MNKTISVIIPVYNVEKYLRDSIESVLSQDYSDLQVIMIDDGSTDHSGEICDEYERADSRIQVIHQKNGGAAAAKNAGLRIASGKYLAFADSDDLVEPGAYSHMLCLLEENNAQAVQCAFRDVYTTHANDRVLKQGRKIWTAEEYLGQYTKDWSCSLLWDKLYERQLFEGIFFPEGNKIDDEFFTYRGMMNAEKIVTDDRIVYNYRKRASSVMRSPQSAQRIVKDRITAISERRKAVLKRYPQLREIYDKHFVESMMILANDPSLTEETFWFMKKEIRTFLKEKDHKGVPKKLLLSFSALLLKRWKKPERPAEADEYTDIYFE